MICRREGPDDILSFIESYYEEGALDRVAQEIQRGLERYPDHATFLEWDAVLANDEGRYKDALDALEGVLELEPDRVFALREKAVCLRNLGRFEEAVELYLRVGPENPQDATFHFDLGQCHDRMGQAALADESFRRAAAIDPDSYPVPPRLSRDEFVGIVARAAATLTPELRGHLEGVDVVLEHYPEEIEPDALTLGRLFPARRRREPSDPAAAAGPAASRPADPGRLVIYQRVFEIDVAEPAAIQDEVARFLQDELADAFGIDDDGLGEILADDPLDAP